MTTAVRRARLLAALGFLEIRWRGYTPDAAGALARWMHSWPGIGAVVVGMQAQGFDVEYPHAWRANFYPTRTAQHSIVLGSAWEPTPSRAVQPAAWTALNGPRAAA